MNASRWFFIAFGGVIALVGLFLAAAAEAPHLTIFAFGLMGFGVLFALSCVKRHFDEAQGAPH
jgi:hypothetical protein